MHRKTGASFRELPSSIWVCDRHRSLHGRLVADGIIDFIQSPFAIVLDYGCGEALSADRVAARCGKLILCDAAASVRSVLLKRYTGHGNVKVIAPEDVQAIPAELPRPYRRELGLFNTSLLRRLRACLIFFTRGFGIPGRS